MNKILLFILLATSFQAFAEGAIGFNASTATTASATALTDEQFKASKEYIHGGLVNKKLEEACKGHESECQGREIDGKYMGLSSNMVKMVAKMYGLVMGGMSGISMASSMSSSSNKSATSNSQASGSNATSGNAANNSSGSSPNNSSKNSDSKMDYCALIPAATEMIATFQQTANQNNLKDLPTNQATAQKDALYRAARSHESRADGSKIQFTGFAAATACYPAQIFMQGGGLDWKSGLKMAASGFLAGFFKSEMDRYNKAAEFTKKVADELPGKGDCNPITQKDCFCAQAESKNYPEYTQTCLPEEFKARQRTALKGTTVSCLNSKGELDTVCNCVNGSSCYDKTLSSKIQGLSFRDAVGAAYSPVASVLNGNLTDGALSASNNNYQNAMGKLRELDKKFPTDNSFADPNDIKALELGGLGPNMAKKLASLSLPSNYDQTLAKIKSNFSGNINIPGKKSNAISSGGDSHIIEFGGFGPAKGKKTSSSNSFDISKFMPGQKKAAVTTGEVLSYPSDSAMNKAMKNADINSDNGPSLFEIVSRRYQISAPAHLGN